MGNMEQAIDVLGDRKHPEIINIDDKEIMIVMDNRQKTTRQTILKMSSDSNMDDQAESKSAKEDRILDSLVYGQEKKDVSKEDSGSISLDWQTRAVELYQNGTKMKTEESVLGIETKSPEMLPFVKNASPNMYKNKDTVFDTKSYNKEDNQSKQLEEEIQIHTYSKNEKIQIQIKNCDDLNNRKIEIDSNKKETETSLDPFKKDELNMNLVYKRKMLQEERNMKLKDQFAEKNVKIDNFRNKVDIKTSNDKNEKQKKNENEKKAKLLCIKKSTINMNMKNDNRQETEKEENNKNVSDVVPEEKNCADMEGETSITETNKTQDYLPNKLRNLILTLHISVDEGMTDLQKKVQKGYSELVVTGCDVTENKLSKYETPNGQPETGKINECILSPFGWELISILTELVQYQK